MAYTKTENLLISGRHRHFFLKTLHFLGGVPDPCPLPVMGMVPGQWSTPKMRAGIGCAELGWSGWAVPNHFPWDSLIKYFSSACKCHALSQPLPAVAWIHLLGEKEDFGATLQMLSHCPCHGREGEMMPLTALPPKIQLSETLLRQRHSTEKFQPQR